MSSCITRLQILQGPSLARLQLVLLDGEFVFDTDEKQVYVGDGVTPGGNPISAPPPRFQLVSASNTLLIASQDDVIHTPTANATALLPTAVGRKKELNYMNASGFQVMMSAQAGQTINGDPTYEFLPGYPLTSITLIPVGGNWYVF